MIASLNILFADSEKTFILSRALIVLKPADISPLDDNNCRFPGTGQKSTILERQTEYVCEDFYNILTCCKQFAPMLVHGHNTPAKLVMRQTSLIA